MQKAWGRSPVRIASTQRRLINTIPVSSKTQNVQSTPILSTPKLNLFAVPAQSVLAKLTPKIQQRLGPVCAHISSSNPNEQNWSAIIKYLYKSGGFSGLDCRDVESLAVSIPNSQRGNPLLLPLFYEMMESASLTPSKFILNLTMAAYAHKGAATVVQAFYDDLKSRGFEPDVHSYGHLIQAYAKNSDVDTVSKIFDEMRQRGVTPSLPVYTSILQTFVRTKEYSQAEKLFEMLKYISLDTQPDIHVFNSMMMAAAKCHAVERVLDLFKELSSRPNNPLEPNEETFNMLIISCAKHPKYHLQAWKYLLELKGRNMVIDRRTINALLYLCAKSGEVYMARAMIRQLATSPDTYPDSFSLWCLFTAYANWKPGVISPVMASEFGPKIRASFLFSSDVPHEYRTNVPFLPHLHAEEHLLAEVEVLYKFFAPQVNSKTCTAFLSVFARHGSISQFCEQWIYLFGKSYALENSKETRSSGDHHIEKPGELLPKESVTPPPSHITAPSWLAYEYALDMATDHKSETFAQQIWKSRGKWRKTPSFRAMTKQEKDRSDFSFAKKMVNFLSVSGQYDQALKIVESTLSQFHWKRSDVAGLDRAIKESEDIRSARHLSFLLGTYHRQLTEDSQLLHS